MERRSVLRTGVASFLALFGAGFALCSKEKKQPVTGPQENGNTVDLDLNDSAHAALRNVGGAMKINLAGVSNPVLVIRRAQDQVGALSVICTHAGCEIGLPQNHEIACPCHDSRFGLDGSVIRGPATQPLPAYPAVIRDQIISITV
ncbi:MAG TPA: Rieske (2Fe-2S) protein [bacterium]|nr:Rieske (2Fe-2S) protein [bacterium]